MIFSVRGAGFGYRGGVQILRDLDFEVGSGELLAVLGPNGVGKTTLLKCMMGFQDWSSGGSYIDGENLRDLPQRSVWRKMAYIPQARDYSYGFTGLEMTVMGRSAHLGTFSQPRKEDVELARAAMERIGILNLADKPCDQMSGGQYQMVLIARALATSPQLLVLDEPETGLDFHNQLVILDLLDGLVHREGLSVVMNTHYPAHALKVADKTLMLGTGCAWQYGATSEVVCADNMRKFFRVEVAFADVEAAGHSVRTVVPVTVC